MHHRREGGLYVPSSPLWAAGLTACSGAGLPGGMGGLGTLVALEPLKSLLQESTWPAE